VLDIKPYVAYTDAIVAARSGWLGDEAAPRDPIPAFDVQWDDAAAEQARGSRRRRARAARTRHRRARARTEPIPIGASAAMARLRLGVKTGACGRRTERLVRVQKITSGYREAQIDAGHAAAWTSHRTEFRQRGGAPRRRSSRLARVPARRRRGRFRKLHNTCGVRARRL